MKYILHKILTIWKPSHSLRTLYIFLVEMRFWFEECYSTDVMCCRGDDDEFWICSLNNKHIITHIHVRGGKEDCGWGDEMKYRDDNYKYKREQERHICFIFLSHWNVRECLKQQFLSFQIFSRSELESFFIYLFFPLQYFLFIIFLPH